jgi:hypothetical protein
LEDDTLGLVDGLSVRAAPALASDSIRAAVAAEGRRGADQAAAVETLCGPGGSLRAVLAPAGYGKTAMAHAAAVAAGSAGRSVLAVATTAKATAELEAAGPRATTIARLAVDVERAPLAAGTVVILDEISQTPTRDAHTVLAAVDACPGGQLWVLGDPRQAQPVKAGGIADEIERRAEAGLLPSARLTENRRQVDAVDREALHLLRGGRPADSQTVRTEAGWEHELGSPEATREAMADAVAADLAAQGRRSSVALAVSHGQAEDYRFCASV